MGSIKSYISERLPENWRKRIWYITDSEYRNRLREQDAKFRQLLESRRKTYSKIWELTDGKLASGPFEGMRYVEQEGAYPTPKVLGSFEKEIGQVIQAMPVDRYSKVIDIGAAEGYYACGFAWRFPHATMAAYEVNTRLHERLKRMAATNGLADRITLSGLCTTDLIEKELSEVEAGRCLIFCDVDGGEWDLLDPEKVPSMVEADLLVEVHESIRPGVSDLLEKRFGATHKVQPIPNATRVIDDFPIDLDVSDELKLASMDEFRSEGTSWLWIERA